MLVIQEGHSSGEDEFREKVTVPSAIIKDMYGKRSKLQEFFEKHHPHKVVANSLLNCLSIVLAF